MSANVLLLDDSAVAGRAMQGILARGRCRCAVSTCPAEAFLLLRETVQFDLVILETRLATGNGLDFMQRLRDDCFLRPIPVVVYAQACEQAQVRRAVMLRTQNYLLKPYNEPLIFAEVGKAVARGWRNVPFAVLPATEAEAGRIAALRRTLMETLGGHGEFFAGCANGPGRGEALGRIAELSAAALAAGFPGLADFLSELRAQAEADNWSCFSATRENLELAGRLIFFQLNPDFVPEALRTDEDQRVQAEAAEYSRWTDANVDAGERPVSPETLAAQVEALSGCPVVDSVAAAFQMMADTRATGLAQLMDFVACDPGLAAQVIAAANRISSQGGLDLVDDARAAASKLGGLKLQAIGAALPMVTERHWHVPPLSWPEYSAFQVGVARMAQTLAVELELDQLGSLPYNAGLLHDLGRLVLVRLHPAAWPAILAYARGNPVTVAEAETKYLGCTTRELGAQFAARQVLPAAFGHVIRWADTPEAATADRLLVAVVALARHLCQQQKVGLGADTPPAELPGIEGTAAWRVLRPEVVPGFNLRAFEGRARAQALRLRHELRGHPR